jgi:repressor LexA
VEIKDILKARRTELGLTQLDVANAVGVSEATVSRWESGDIANMKRSRIASLASVLKISPSIIMGWNGTPEIRLPSDVITIIPMPTMRKVPLIGSIACGTPILAEENCEGEVDVPDHIRADFALRCKGDSMINARIFDGDIVYIRQQESVEHGEIAAVIIDDEATLKRVYLYEDHISLEAENPQYRPLVYWEAEMNNVRILGRAVAFTSVIR